MTESDHERQLRDVNDALIVASVRQHELAEQAQRAETGLRASEAQFRELVEQVKDYAIFRIGLDGRAVTWNEGVARVLGFAEDEFIGTDITQAIFTPEDVAAGVPQVELEVAARLGAAGNDRWMRRKDGQRFFALGTTTALEDEQGRVTGFTKVMCDRTSLKRAEDALRTSEEQFRRAIEDAPIPIILHTEDGEVLQISRSWTELTGYRIEDIPTVDVAYGFGADTVRQRVKELFEGTLGIVQEEFEISTRSREKRVWAFSASSPGALRDGRRFVVGMAVDITERKRADETRARLAAIVESSNDAIISTDIDAVITSWNAGAQRLYGYTAQEALGEPVTIFLPFNRPDEESEILERMRRGASVQHFETVRRRKDGTTVDISLTVSPILDSRGQFVGVSKIARDVTERKRTEEHTNMLLREVSHRSKNNLLAVVQAVARQSAREEDPFTFVQQFSARVAGLAASQDLLVQNNWGGVDVGDLVRAQLSHHDVLIGTRIALDGPALRVKPAAAQSLGMALHELATNATKYGALSNGDGTVSLSWNVSADGGALRYHMSWRERGGPPVAQPSRRGFGHTVIGRMVQHALDAEVSLDYAPAGLDWRISAPAAVVVERASERGAEVE